MGRPGRLTGFQGDKGGDDFVKEKGGLHSGIRRIFVPWYDDDADGSSREPKGVKAKGVKAIEIPDIVDDGAPGLKYATPDVSKKSIDVLLSLPEIYLFANSDHMDILSRKKFSRAWTEKVAADGKPAPDGLVVDVRKPVSVGQGNCIQCFHCIFSP